MRPVYPNDSIQIEPVSGPFDDAGDTILPKSGLIRPIPGAQTLVGGAPVARATLAAARRIAPRLVAADGGADALLAAGLAPDLVVGDLDSISPAARAAFAARIVHVPEQDSTDFEKALRASPAPLTIAVGFLGARLDHALACLSALARDPAPCILLSETDCVFVAPPRLRLDLAAGTRVSLWPLGPATGRSEGLRWPIDGIAMAPAGRVGTSNAAEGPVAATFEGGPVAVILPAGALGAAIAALAGAPRGSGAPPL